MAADALGLSSSPPPAESFFEFDIEATRRATWEASHFLEPELYMPFQEPQSIELERPVNSRGTPNFLVDAPETVFGLFKKWDSLGLLALHLVLTVTTGESSRVKIFNNFKSVECGDRRERNAWEGRIPRPSSVLPLGTR